MGLTSSNLALIRYVQEKQGVSLEKLASKFRKNQTSIRREVEMINLHSNAPLINIKKSSCTTPLSYKEYTQFIRDLSFSEFTSTSDERISSILVNIFFNKVVNTSQLYESWDLSLTTKKSDLNQLRTLLAERNCQLVFVRKKGLSIEGNPLFLRLLVIQNLYPLFEVSPDATITLRVANNPLEKQMIQLFTDCCSEYVEESTNLIQSFLTNYSLSITNPSRKILLCFLCLQKAFPIKEDLTLFKDLLLPKLNLYVTENKFENELLNLLLMNLDFRPALEFPFDQSLWDITEDYVKNIIRYISTDIHTQDDLVTEVYKFFYKQIGRSYFHFTLVDRLVKTTEENFPILYQVIEKFSIIYEKKYRLSMNDDITSALTFIFEKATLRNRVINNRRKRVVVISNSSYERIDYFMTNLKVSLEIDYVDSLYLTDLQRLETLQYDYVFCFSERIYDILKSQDIPVILLNFFMTEQNIDALLLYGFERIKTKFLTKNLIQELANIHESQIEEYLKTAYPDYFI